MIVMPLHVDDGCLCGPFLTSNWPGCGLDHEMECQCKLCARSHSRKPYTLHDGNCGAQTMSPSRRWRRNARRAAVGWPAPLVASAHRVPKGRYQIITLLQDLLLCSIFLILGPLGAHIFFSTTYVPLFLTITGERPTHLVEYLFYGINRWYNANFS